MGAFTSLAVGKKEVVGLENLDKVPANTKLIVATGHTSDIEIPLITSSLGKYLNLIVTNLSLHRSISSDPTLIGLYLAGMENFLRIQYRVVKGERRGILNPEDYTKMVDAFDRGKAIVIAAHNPSFNGIMPDKPGLGVAYLAGKVEDSMILPVIANIEGNLGQASILNALKTLITKPKVTIAIGEPFKLSQDPNVNSRKLLVANAERVMRSIANLYPEEKRGRWGQDV